MVELLIVEFFQSSVRSEIILFIKSQDDFNNKLTMDEKVIKENFLKRIYQKIREISNLHDDTNIEATIASITKDIEFKGANVWILFLAVIVASVGLNVNSTAVIIGAMLISPLMGPINGVGLAIGIDDNVGRRHGARLNQPLLLDRGLDEGHEQGMRLERF